MQPEGSPLNIDLNGRHQVYYDSNEDEVSNKKIISKEIEHNERRVSLRYDQQNTKSNVSSPFSKLSPQKI
jgi:hypothetical protein